MLLQLLKSKLHHARVTHCQPDYVGSIGISQNLLDASGLIAGELVHVWAVDQPARCVTYVIPVEEEGIIALKGGIARHYSVGDRIVVAAFALSATPITPTTVILNEQNAIIDVTQSKAIPE